MLVRDQRGTGWQRRGRFRPCSEITHTIPLCQRDLYQEREVFLLLSQRIRCPNEIQRPKREPNLRVGAIAA